MCLIGGSPAKDKITWKQLATCTYYTSWYGSYGAARWRSSIQSGRILRIAHDGLFPSPVDLELIDVCFSAAIGSGLKMDTALKRS